MSRRRQLDIIMSRVLSTPQVRPPVASAVM